MQMTTGKITVKSILKKTKTRGFSDLKVGDSIEICSNFQGEYKGAPIATVRNLQDGKEYDKYFLEVVTAIKLFEWEEQ